MNFKKISAVTLVLTLAAALLLSGCNSANNQSAEATTPTATKELLEDAKSEIVTIDFMPQKASSQTAALSADDPTISFLEEKFSFKFNIIDTSSKENPMEYSEILTSLISSGQIPDFMVLDVLGSDSDEYSKLVESGVALDVGSFMEQKAQNYPNISKNILDDKSLEKYKTDDSLYCLPHYCAPDDTVYLVRGDWVDRAGYILEDINTLEKFSELMTVFEENDFDGVSAVGFSASTEKNLYPIYAGYTGAYMFKNVDGYYTDWYTLYELRESLGYIYLMYESKAFDREYLSHDGAVPKDKITTGKAGCIATEITNLPMLNDQLQENIPEGYLEPLPVNLSGPGGTTRVTDKRYASANVISTYFEDPVSLFDMLEYIFSDEGQALVSYGIEGIHYEKDGENILPNYNVYGSEGWKYLADGTVNGLQPYNEIRNIITNFNVITAPEYSKTASLWYDSLLNYDKILSNPFEDNGFHNSRIIASMTAVKDKWVDRFISGSKRLTDKNWEAFVKEYLEAGAQEQMDFYNSK